MIIDEEKFDGAWYEFDGDTKFNIVPYNFSIIDVEDEISNIIKYRFMYCLVGWDGLVGKKGKIFKYTEDNKEYLYNYYNDVRDFVFKNSEIRGGE